MVAKEVVSEPPGLESRSLFAEIVSIPQLLDYEPTQSVVHLESSHESQTNLTTNRSI